MIITKTPLRISFLGGGSDLPDYYKNNGMGMVISSAISPSVYVILKERYDRKVYVGYSKTEICDMAEQVEHELIRECLKYTDVRHGVEIKILADVPGEGSGLGSSSSLVVGLLNALHTYKGDPISAETLAEEACEIEIDRLKKPIGKQDQYIAAFGGFRSFTFWRDGKVDVGYNLNGKSGWPEVEDRLMLFHTGINRKSEDILGEQRDNLVENKDTMTEMVKLAVKLDGTLYDGDLTPNLIGTAIYDSWRLKKSLASGITSDKIEELRRAAELAGAVGFKVTGAGGGGHILTDSRPDKKEDIRAALAKVDLFPPSLREVPFRLERYGSRVIFRED